MGSMQLGMSRGDPASSSGGMTPADVQGFQEILASQRQASQMQMQQQVGTVPVMNVWDVGNVVLDAQRRDSAVHKIGG